MSKSAPKAVVCVKCGKEPVGVPIMSDQGVRKISLSCGCDDGVKAYSAVSAILKWNNKQSS